MNNKHLSWNKEINNNFIIASIAYSLQIIVAFRFKLTEAINKKHLAIKIYLDYGPEFVPNFIQMKFELFGLWTWIFLKKLGVGTKVLLWKFWWG